MNPICIICSTLLLLTGIVNGFGQPGDYARISMAQQDYDNVRSVLDVDHVHHKRGRIIFEVSSTTLDRIDKRNIPYETLVGDLQVYYEDQNRRILVRSEMESCDISPHSVPKNFRLGSMGGYLTLEELVSELDEMHQKFPSLITKPQPISDFKTHEGRSILWTSITGRKNTSGEKKGVLYTALHHSREPLSMQQMVYFMWYILENYNTDPTIKKLLDKTQLYFIPCVNPDGYAYNARVSPDGGGMWRKNRRPLGNDNYGVDLNRNYGYKWGSNNSGSSDDPASDLYRGASAFSEPETKAIKWFCENYGIFSALNYHAYGDYLIYPWGYTSEETSHDRHFKSLAKSLTFEKRILYGTSRETVLYTTNGDADDWMYGETGTKNRIYSMTPEAGPAEYGFWPPKNRIEMLCGRELDQNIRMAIAPHGFVMMVPSVDPVIYSTNIKHRFYLYPVTLDDGVVQSVITPLTNNIVDYEESLYFFGLGNKEEYEMDLKLDPALKDGELVQFAMKLDNGELSVVDTITYIYSNSNESIGVLSRSTDIDNWVRSNQSTNSWGSTKSEYYTEPSSITDSPQGLYSTATENAIVSSESYRIPREEDVFLTFKAKWDITYGEDFAQLSISTDGVNFVPLCGQLTTENFDYKGDITPVYTGIQDEWLTERMSLNQYKGENVYFKWNMVSQSAEARDGIFVDDMKITFSQTITSAKDDIVDWTGHRIYPNPVRGGEIYLDIGHDEANPIAKFQIRNQFGQLMVEDQLQTGVNKIGMNGLSAGVYFLGLETIKGQRIGARKIIVLP